MVSVGAGAGAALSVAAPLPAPERGAGAGRVAGAGALAAGSGVTSGVVTGRTSAAEDGEEAVGAPDGLEGGVRPSSEPPART